jgi:hypothetical protein
MVVEVYGHYVANGYHGLAISANFKCAAAMSIQNCFGIRKGDFIRCEALSADELNVDDSPRSCELGDDRDQLEATRSAIMLQLPASLWVNQAC